MSDEGRPPLHQPLNGSCQKESQQTPGQLKIFFGMSPGVGKTYAMLQEAHLLLKEGVRVVAAAVNAHGRLEVEQLLEGIPRLPEQQKVYEGKIISELDIESILESRPDGVLIDELAHANESGSKHSKRWQEVVELLDAGINVFTTLNVQDVESRKDLVEAISGIQVHETVPDLILERANEIALIDITPAELLKRLQEGKVYLGNQSPSAIQNFFQEGHLMAIREIALRLTAEKVDHDLHGILASARGWRTRERLMVAVTAEHSSEQLIRTARRMAFELDAPWMAVYIGTGEVLNPERQARVNKHLNLARELGAEVVAFEDVDPADAFGRIAKERNATRLLISRSSERGFLKRCFRQTLVGRLMRENEQMDLLILRQDKLISVYKQVIPSFQLSEVIWRYGGAALLMLTAIAAGFLFVPLEGYKAVGFFFLAAILLLGVFAGTGPTLLAALLSALSWDFLFVPPPFSYGISDPEDVSLMVIYFFAAGIVGVLAHRVHSQKLLLHRREKNMRCLYGIMREVAKAADLPSLKSALEVKLRELFNAEFDILVRKESGELVWNEQLLTAEEETDRAAALWCLRTGKMGGWSTETLPSAKGLSLPIVGEGGTVVGVFMYRPRDGRPLSVEQLQLLQNVAEQLAVYLERSAS